MGLPLQVGAWQHLVIVTDFSGFSSDVYLDGQYQDTVTLIQPPNLGSGGNAEFGIGGHPGSTHQHFHGRIAEFAIYGRALTLAEIQESAQLGRLGCRFTESVGPNASSPIVLQVEQAAEDLRLRHISASGSCLVQASSIPGWDLNGDGFAEHLGLFDAGLFNRDPHVHGAFFGILGWLLPSGFTGLQSGSQRHLRREAELQ
jgi:hypothetical protein